MKPTAVAMPALLAMATSMTACMAIPSHAVYADDHSVLGHDVFGDMIRQSQADPDKATRGHGLGAYGLDESQLTLLAATRFRTQPMANVRRTFEQNGGRCANADANALLPPFQFRCWADRRWRLTRLGLPIESAPPWSTPSVRLVFDFAVNRDDRVSSITVTAHDLDTLRWMETLK